MMAGGRSQGIQLGAGTRNLEDDSSNSNPLL